ncbi:MAG: hypothetical protein RQ982_06890 [Gammaproteobacteria bacterium]|nr:hypothetical protein [Gammaproteobacteria bacterium]
MRHRVVIPVGSDRVAVMRALNVFICNLALDQAFDVVVTKHKRQRTKLQNRSCHQYFSLLSDALNDAGLDMKKVLKPEIAIPWTDVSVKNHIWRPIQIAMLDKDSTTELEAGEVSRVYDVVDRHLSGKLGIHVPFPARDCR